MTTAAPAPVARQRWRPVHSVRLGVAAAAILVICMAAWLLLLRARAKCRPRSIRRHIPWQCWRSAT